MNKNTKEHAKLIWTDFINRSIIENFLPKLTKNKVEMDSIQNPQDSW